MDPDGTRLVLCDGYVLVAADALLGGALAVGGPVQPDAIIGLTFVGRHQLLTSGQEGGLTLWQLGGSHMRPHIERATPRMEHLFSVPEWDVVGGKAPGEGRVHFLDPDTLAPRPAPPALTGTEHLNLITTSPTAGTSPTRDNWPSASPSNTAISTGTAAFTTSTTPARSSNAP